MRVSFNCGHFDRNKISFRVIKCYVNTTLNEIIRSKASPLAQMDKVKKTCCSYFCCGIGTAIMTCIIVPKKKICFQPKVITKIHSLLDKES